MTLLAVLGGFATLVVLSQAIVRQIWAQAPEATILRTLGFTTRDLAAVGVVQGLVIGGIGALVAIVFAVATSPLTPIGRARAIETDPGLRVDALVFGLGALILLVVTRRAGDAGVGVGRRPCHPLAEQSGPGEGRA